MKNILQAVAKFFSNPVELVHAVPSETEALYASRADRGQVCVAEFQL
jgi:hypothetical protein